MTHAVSTRPEPVTVLVVSDRAGTSGFVADVPSDARVRPVGRVTSAGATRAVHEHRPDVVLAEVSSFDQLAALTGAVMGSTPTIVVSALPSEAVLLGCLSAGARGFLLKPVCPPVLEHALDVVASGSVYVDQRAMGWLVELALHGRSAQTDRGLSLRQSQVLQLAGEGMTNRDIAAALGVSVDTVKSHLYEAMRKLGIHDRRDAARRAEAVGVTPGEAL